jgi:ring-1,2-phenylacetyl-CoA epoxidase subunit PaaB
MKQNAARGLRPEQGKNSMSRDWPLWEIFIRSKGGLSHKHVGSVHAPDSELALRHARDVYTRRLEGVSIWAVRSSDIVASDPAQAGPLFEPAETKIYRHPTFYEIPDVVKHI